VQQSLFLAIDCQETGDVPGELYWC
jgi:hypothetical protein